MREVAKLLRALDDLKKTLVVVSHDMDFAQRDLRPGHLLRGRTSGGMGTATAVFRRPVQPETRAFMDSFNSGRGGGKP